jgi:hypothetical protein
LKVFEKKEDSFINLLHHMMNIMIYAIENHIYIQSNEMMQDVRVDIRSSEGKYLKSCDIKNSCYEKIEMGSNLGKVRVRITGDKRYIEKQIIV